MRGTSSEGGGDQCPRLDSLALDGDDAGPYALSLLRSSCDSCWKKKCKCSGDMPCSRCSRAGVQCTYSTKRKLGRPRGLAAANKLQAQQHQQHGGGRRSARREIDDADGSRLSPSADQQFSASPATGLGGLAESRFLSCFLEHFTPMFPVANEVSIRDGLMHSFARMWYGGAPALRGQEAFRGRALECAFFSSVAIGGLLSGHPPEAVKNHIASAQASVVEFHGLADKHAVSALILSGMMNMLLPPGAGGAGAGGDTSITNANADGRRSLDEAEAIFGSLPKKDPLVGVILTFRRQVEALALIDAASLCPPPVTASSSSSSSSRSASASRSLLSKKPPRKAAAAGGRGSGLLSKGGGEPTKGGEADENQARRSQTLATFPGAALTEEGKAILAGKVETAGGGRGGDAKPHGGGAPLGHPAHPSFVASDALLLSARFMRGGGGEGGVSQLRHVHDYVATELNRLVPARAGALVLISLAGTLLAIKTRLQLTDGMLPMAELTTAMLTKCPGWGRSYGRHAAHLALAVFKLYGHRDSYKTLRSILQKNSERVVPAFDEDTDAAAAAAGGGEQLGVVQHACGLSACRVLSGSLLALTPPDSGEDVARSGTGGGSASNNSGGITSSDSTGSRKSNRKRPSLSLSPRGGAAKKQKESGSTHALALPVPPQQQQQLQTMGLGLDASNPVAVTGTRTEAAAASEAAAAAWELPGSEDRSAGVRAIVTPSKNSSVSPGTRYFPSSSHIADGAAAAAASAAASSTGSAAAAAAASLPAGHAEPPANDHNFGVERFGGARESSASAVPDDGGAHLWPAAGSWRSDRGDGVGRADGGGLDQGLFGGFIGANSTAHRIDGHPSTGGQNHHHPPQFGLPHAQGGSSSSVVASEFQSRGGGGADFVSGNYDYGPAAALQHGRRVALDLPLPASAQPCSRNYLHHHQQQQQHRRQQQHHQHQHHHCQQQHQPREGGRPLAGSHGYESTIDGGAGDGTWWQSNASNRFPSSPAQPPTAETPTSLSAGASITPVTTSPAEADSWQVQERGVSAAATTGGAAAAADGRTAAWTDTSMRAREGVPAWFGGVGAIALPPPDHGSDREWGSGGCGTAGRGGGGRHHKNPSFGASFALAQQWRHGPAGSESGIVAGSVGPSLGGGVGIAVGAGGCKTTMMSPTHSRIPSFRANGGAQHVVDTSPGSSHARRTSSRAGSEFDFVYELGMLLDE